MKTPRKGTFRPNWQEIERLCIQKGWKDEKLADEAGCSLGTVQRLKTKKPAYLETLKAFAKALGVPHEAIIEYEPHNGSSSFVNASVKVSKDANSNEISLNAYFHIHISLEDDDSKQSPKVRAAKELLKILLPDNSDIQLLSVGGGLAVFAVAGSQANAAALSDASAQQRLHQFGATVIPPAPASVNLPRMVTAEAPAAAEPAANTPESIADWLHEYEPDKRYLAFCVHVHNFMIKDDDARSRRLAEIISFIGNTIPDKNKFRVMAAGEGRAVFVADDDPAGSNHACILKLLARKPPLIEFAAIVSYYNRPKPGEFADRAREWLSDTQEDLASILRRYGYFNRATQQFDWGEWDPRHQVSSRD